jgi:hypothetical protein
VALFDALLLGAAGWWLFTLVRAVVHARRSGWLPALGDFAVRSATAVAALYLVFLAVWGLNYRRLPLAEKLQFDAGRVSRARVLGLAQESVRRLDALHDAAHAIGWPESGVLDSDLAKAFDRAQRELGTRRAVPGRPKRTIIDGYFRRAGVAGMTDPYFLETLIASDLLPFERSFVAAHEWSHLAGIADEGEANLAGWLTCLRGGVPHQYSGWLFLYGELAASLDESGRRAIAERLDSGPRRDLIAIRQRLEREVSPRLSAAGWRVYDQFLKANRIDAGAASYAEVVRLVAGVEFGPDWAPLRRQ